METDGSPSHRIRPLACTAVCVLCLACSVGCNPDAPSDELEALLEPSLVAVEPAVRNQLLEARAQLAQLRESGSPSAVGAAYGSLGEHYHAYDLLEPAAACYRNALRLGADPSRYGYHLAGVYNRQGRLEDAWATLEGANLATPGVAPILARAGELALRRSEPEIAERHFRAALDADPDCATARYGLGEAARANGDLDQAAVHFRATLSQQPQAVQVLYPLGQTLLRLGRQEEANAYLKRAAERRMSVGGRPTCSSPWEEDLAGLTRSIASYLTRGLHHAYSGRHEAALREYEKALDRDAQDPVVRQSMASSLASLGRWPESVVQYREAVRLAPEDADLRRDLGVIAAAAGELGEARTHLSKALELRPGFAAAHFQLGLVSVKQGRLESALHSFGQALDYDPQHPQARLERVKALMQLGRRTQLLDELSNLLDDYPPEDENEVLRLTNLLAAIAQLEQSEER